MLEKRIATPVLDLANPTQPLTGVEEIYTGRSFSCIRLTAGSINCWGNNFVGQVGNNNPSISTIPFLNDLFD